MNKTNDLQVAVFGNGCFWCTEAIFSQLKGVVSVTSGYAGGHTLNPTYQQVCSDTTGHAEVVRITFDPSLITYADLLEIFWQIHDPTTLNRQGNDVSSQYRSIVLPMNQEQEQIAQKMVQKLKEQKVFPSPIVTEITPLKEFYPAEKYHENYYFLNEEQPYCQLVISPKLQKFRKKYQDRLSS